MSCKATPSGSIAVCSGHAGLTPQMGLVKLPLLVRKTPEFRVSVAPASIESSHTAMF